MIGSVLLRPPGSLFGEVEEQRIRDSVGQAAPVLANLRNLAVAEIRAATDGLTGLPNKRAVTRHDEADVRPGRAHGRPARLARCSTWTTSSRSTTESGTRSGTRSWPTSAPRSLRSVLRARDFAGRNGGEEFVILLPDTATAGACETAERIRAAIAEIAVPGDDRTLTASVGVAAYPDHASTLERLERLADAALYVAKRSGRDRVEVAGTDTPPPPVTEDVLSRLG